MRGETTKCFSPGKGMAGENPAYGGHAPSELGGVRFVSA